MASTKVKDVCRELAELASRIERNDVTCEKARLMINAYKGMALVQKVAIERVDIELKLGNRPRGVGETDFAE